MFMHMKMDGWVDGREVSLLSAWTSSLAGKARLVGETEHSWGAAMAVTVPGVVMLGKLSLPGMMNLI